METSTVEKPQDLSSNDPGSLPLIQTIACATIEGVSKLDLPLLKIVAKLFSPKVLYPVLKDLQALTPAVIEAHILNEVSFAERDFWARLSHLHVFIENQGVETLLAEGIRFEDDESRSEYMARQLEANGDRISMMVMSMVARSAGDMGDIPFHLFSSGFSAGVVGAKLSAITPQQIQAVMTKHFQGKGYGRFCHPIKVGKNSQWGVVIKRGARRITNVVLNKQDQQHLSDNRFVETDSIFFIPETNALWIHCHGTRDARMYAQVIAELINEPTAFSKSQVFDMSPFLEKDVASSMVRASQKVLLNSVEVRGIQVSRAQGGKVTIPAGRWGACLTEQYYSIPEIDPANEMTVLKLRLIASPDRKSYVDLEIKSGSIKMGSGLCPIMVCEFLIHLSIWNLHGNC